MRAWSLEGGARAVALVAAVSCGCANVVTIDETGGGGTSGTTTTETSAGGQGGATSSTAGGSGGEGGVGPGGSTGTTVSGCQENADCLDHPNGPICNKETGECVSCIVLPSPAADCGIGSWCNEAKGQCEIGCTGPEDCPSLDGDLLCDLADHTCKGCLVDTDCPIGSICVSDTCVPGCSLEQPCAAGKSCCGQSCYDLASDENNCGACNFACPFPPWASPVCGDGQCKLGICDEGHADCDGDPFDGCEQNVLVDGPCVCSPGETQACYQGAPGTQGVGQCKGGTRTCKLDGVTWGPCEGQVLPSPELCASGADENCDGSVDENVDADGDGWGKCEGDCNDSDPKVNPGAIEINYVLVDDDNNYWTPPIKVYSGNAKDDDCDPATPDVGELPPCASTAKLTGVTATDLAAAMELCQTTAANPPKPQKTWGLVSAQLLRPDGSAPGAAQLADMMDKQAAVLAGYGVSAPKVGATMVGLSTGMMRDQDDPGAVPPSPGTDLGWTGSPPAAYLSANFGVLPPGIGCNGVCPNGSGANDGVLLRLVVRVPTNVNAFSFDFRAFTAGYPGTTCSAENDFFLARLTSLELVIPPDDNVAFDNNGNPLSVNHLFPQVCAPSACYTCPNGAGDLAGTGMSAATSWLVADVPIVSGETMTLDLTVFDVTTGTGDWVTLVDGFRWHQSSQGPGPFP